MTCSFIPLLLSTYYVPDIILGTWKKQSCTERVWERHLTLPALQKVRQKSQKSLTAIVESSMKDMVEKRKVRKDLLRGYYFGLDFKMRINRASRATLW